MKWCRVSGTAIGVVYGRWRGKWSGVGSVEWEVEWCSGVGEERPVCVVCGTFPLQRVCAVCAGQYHVGRDWKPPLYSKSSPIFS